MKEIELTQNQVAIVDDEDFEWLSELKWYAHKGTGNKTFYAVRQLTVSSEPYKQIVIRIHNAIWEHYYGPIAKGYTVDHIDLNGLNEQKINLRRATSSQQQQNKGLNKKNTSGFIGDSFDKKTQKYRAYIKVERKFINLGYFYDPIEAAYVRDVAAIQYGGEFAVLNFPEGGF